MNYYIQGNKEKADQIKATFEKLGYNTGNLGFTSGQLYYTVEGKVELMCIKSLQNLIKTHPDYKELELPVEPKFKVGDSLQSGSHFTKILSINLEEGRYYCDNRIISFENQDLWHLAPKPHYDIANFYAGMPVLVRDYNNSQWSYVQFSHLIAERNVGEGGFKFNACGIPYIQCIPFNEETKHLLGTTDMCDEQYINW